MRNHRLIACAALLLLLLGITTTLPARGRKQKQAAAAAMSEHQRALHALNRLTFGPRPGDVEKVESMGVDKWIDLQLHPEKIDDSSLNARLAPYRTLNMSTAEMIEDFPPPQVIKAVADGKLPMPRDPMKRAVYQAQIERYQERQQSKAEKADAADDTAASGADDTMMPADRERRRAAREQAAGDEPRLAAMPPDERLQAILKMDPNERMALVRGATPQVRQELMNDFTPQQQETVLALVAPQLVIGNELASAKLLRAVYSDRQLQEVMTDFWFNHFNVFINKGADRYLVTAYERDVIRPRALGKFKDLLLATAKSPAMLFYLDNWQSVGPDSDFAKYGPERQQRPFARNGGFGRRRRGGGFGRPFPPRQRPQRDPQQQAQRQQKRPSGLNENYAREVMELHTLGVDGGYTQNDVTELARVLTGWTIREPRRGGGFTFDERRHEPGTKVVLGHTFKGGGEKEGEQALEMLARSPATAHHISVQLAQRFVSDNPPPALVERMAATFLKSDGDIREVLRTMLRSPEFWSQDAYRAKVKTPLEFVASALRATNADVKNPQPLIGALNQMGMPLYAMQPPTGYSTQAQAWVNSAALLNRLNFALALGTGRLRGVLVDEKAAIGGSVAPDANGVLAALEQALLSGEVSAQTHDVLEKQLNDPQVTRRQLDDPARPPAAGVIAGLILGSPDFQKR